MRWRSAIKVAVSAGLLGWLLGRSDLSQIWTGIARLNLSVLLVALGIYVAAVVLSAAKWRLLLPRYSLWTLAAVGVIGNFYSVVLPGQIVGEIVKAYRLGKGRADAERIAASVMVDKVTGLLALVMLGVAGINVTTMSIPAPIVVGLTLLLLSCFVLMMSLWLEPIYALARAGCRTVGRVAPFSWNARQHLLAFVDSWRTFIGQPLTLTASIALGLVLQLLYVAVIVMLASKIGIELRVADWLWVFAVVSLAVLLPLSLGGIGIREGAFVGVLGFLGVAAELALALSLTIFAFQILVASAGAILDFSRVGKALSDR
jgi:glycosyltransferase 2 family protein